MTLRLAMRMLRKQPLFSSAILVMLALGIGATTAIFSVVQGVLLKPLPFPEADRLLEVWGTLPARNISQTSFTEANFWDMRDLNRTARWRQRQRGIPARPRCSADRGQSVRAR